VSTYSQSAEYHLEQQEEVLRLIVARVPNLAADAALALRSEGAASRQARLDRLAVRALRATDAGWTAEERQLLADAIWTAGADGAPAHAPARTRTLRLRVTEDEETRLKAAADERGMTLSDLVRERLDDILNR
jgi:hypothetical protein